MKNIFYICAFVLATALMASPGIAETETIEPRVLTLSDSTDTVLPGDQAGTRHGVKINRGSGFPEPVIVVVEPQVEAVQAETVQPAPRSRGLSLRRSYSW